MQNQVFPHIIVERIEMMIIRRVDENDNMHTVNIKVMLHRRVGVYYLPAEEERGE